MRIRFRAAVTKMRWSLAAVVLCVCACQGSTPKIIPPNIIPPTSGSGPEYGEGLSPEAEKIFEGVNFSYIADTCGDPALGELAREYFFAKAAQCIPNDLESLKKYKARIDDVRKALQKAGQLACEEKDKLKAEKHMIEFGQQIVRDMSRPIDCSRPD